MSDKSAILVEGVSKTFWLPHEKQKSLKGALINFKKRGYEKQIALSGISFDIKEGEFFGIVGRNGSGKSTLLKMLAGIYAPSEGQIHINGKLTPFIELGVGFNEELTGRENVYLNGALFGFSRREMDAMYGDIVKFAELERFMDQKLKNYSSGMQVRLAFSIAIRAQSDILVLDEVLAVGDAAFQKKCYDYFATLQENKKTVVLVTHDMGAVRQYCDRAILIEGGKIVKMGSAETIAQAYQKLFIENAATTEAKHEAGTRWGEGGIHIQNATVRIHEKTIDIFTSFLVNKDLPPPVYGFSLYSQKGINLLESNTLRLEYKTQKVAAGQHIKLQWTIPNILRTGKYKLSVACCDASATRFYEWLNEAAVFEIVKEKSTSGAIDPEVTVANAKGQGK